MDASHLQSIIARLPSIALLVQQGQVCWISRPIAFGWPEHVLRDGTLSLLWHPEDRELAMAAYQEDQGPGEQRTLRVVTADGSIRWVDLEVDRGPQAGTLLILTEVTERIEADRLAAEAKAGLARLAACSNEILCVVDQQQRVTWTSGSVLRILGWDPDDLIGTVLADLVHPQDQNRPSPGRRGEWGIDPLLRLRARDGRYRWMRQARGDADLGCSAISFTEVEDLVEHVQSAWRAASNLHGILQASPMAHLLLAPIRDDGGQVTDFGVAEANAQARTWLHAEGEEGRGARLGASLDADHGPLLDWLREALDSDSALALQDWQVSTADGHPRWVELNAAHVGDHLSLAWREVTKARQGTERLRSSERRYRLAAENAFDAVAWLEGDLIQWVTASITSMLGWLPQEWAGRRLEEFVHRDDLEAFGGQVHLDLRAFNEQATTEVRNCRIRAKDLRYHWAQMRLRNCQSADGNPAGVAVTLRIVDSEVAERRELDRMACTDDLTGLLNRREALARIAGLAAHTRRSGSAVAMLLCDVDRFKEVNDAHGHAVGDHVLKMVASRIVECIRGADLAARVGGDELLVVLDGVHGLADAMDIAEKIRVAASMPIALAPSSVDPVEQEVVHVTLSIGVVLLEGLQQVEALFAQADVAMYQAKRAGSNRVVCLPVAGSRHLHQAS